MTQSGKSLFKAIKKHTDPDPRQAEAFGDLPDHVKPEETRDPLDYDPTPADATHAFLDVEDDRIREIGSTVWEPAVGGGHMARPLSAHGFRVIRCLSHRPCPSRAFISQYGGLVMIIGDGATVKSRSGGSIGTPIKNRAI